LSNQTIQVLVVGSLQAKVTTTDVINSFVINHERTIGVLKCSMGSQDRVVWLNNRGGSLWSRIDAELQFALLAIIHGQTLHKESTEARTSSTAERMEDQESLETSAVIGNTANLVKDLIDQLLADCVVTASIIVGGVLLASYHMFGVEQAAVGTGADLIHNIGLEVAVDGAGNIFTLTCTATYVSRSTYDEDYELIHLSRRRKY
jgi:hypothetical protein